MNTYLLKFFFTNKQSKPQTFPILKTKNLNTLPNFLDVKPKKKPEVDILNIIDTSKITNPNVIFVNKYRKTEYNEELRDSTNTDNFKKLINPNSIQFDSKDTSKATPIPLSPKLVPYEVLNPKLENKSYHWCSCGLSKNQPYCDRSHKNTAFKPINFVLSESTKRLLLCGCKLSTNKPFCDKETCLRLKQEEDKVINMKDEYLSENVEVKDDSSSSKVDI